MISPILFMRFLLAGAALTTSYSNAQATLAPLILVALLVDAAVVAVWYFVGSLLNNGRIKGAALGEFYQFIGTVILVGILLGSLTMISGAFYTAYGTTSLMSPTAISSMCTKLMTTTQFDLISSSNSLLSGPTTGTKSFPGLCSIVQAGSTTSLTNRINYPLAAAGVIVANLTNQTVANLDYAFTMDAWLGFLANLHPTISLCLAPAREGVPCLIPNPIITPTFMLVWNNAPYAGYTLLVDSLQPLATLLNLSTESFVVQLLLLAILLYAWPWLLFGGIVLRSTLFTRRLGGTLIAIALVGIFIYPAVFSIEYLSLGKGFDTSAASSIPGGYSSAYGFNVITTLPAKPTAQWPQWQKAGTMSGNYVVNFFVEPNIKAIAWSYSCWPNILGGYVSGGLFSAEVKDTAYLMIPLTGVITELKYIAQGSLTSSFPSFNLPAYCSPANALSTFFAMMDAYGIIGLVSFFIPLINIVVSISSIQGLSELLGGDTSLAGLARIL